MSFAQFSMVEELASLVKDNLPSKHLILSMEESLVNFLQDDSSTDGVLELEPTNAYNRLLLHRLAEIFGFSHQSVGEGDDRHLVFERCPETSIPSVLVSDLLWEYDEFEPLSSAHQLLKSDKASSVNDVVKVRRPSPTRRHTGADKNTNLYDLEIKSDIAIGQLSLKERKAAYLAARERIFSGVGGETNRFTEQKPRSDPVVARRMISHALGRKLDPSNQTISHKISDKNGVKSDGISSPLKDVGSTNLEQHCKPDVHYKNMAPNSVKETPDTPGVSRPCKSKVGLDKESLKQEHIGAARRMFAHALGLPSGKDGTRKSALK